jgi:polyisoprenoid-binding protein YceI
MSTGTGTSPPGVKILLPGDDLSQLTGRWELDPTHSSVGISVSYARFTLINARFADHDGTVVIDCFDPAASTVDVAIRTASFDSGMPMRDAHVAAADFLDAAGFPDITFRGERISVGEAADGRYLLEGRLKLHGITRRQRFDVLFHGAGPDMMGNTRLGFGITGMLSREGFGVGWNAPVPGGARLLPDTVNVVSEMSLLPEGTGARIRAAMAAGAGA